MSCRTLLLAVLLAAPTTAQETLETLEFRYLDAEARGREAEMLDLSLRIVETVAAQPQTFAPWRRAAFEVHVGRLEQTATGLARHAETAARLRALPARHLDGWMDARRWYAVQRLAHFGNDLDGAAQATAELGFVQSFWVLGPLDNERGAGFARPTPAERSFDRALRLRGKEREVGWRAVPLRDRSRGVVSLDALFRPNDQCLAYAIAFFESPDARDAVLDVGSDEALQAFWNGDRVLSRDVRRTWSFQQDRAAVRLRAGTNACLLKVCDQEDAWRFSLRLTDLDGRPLQDVRVLDAAPETFPFEGGPPPLGTPSPDGPEEARAAAAAGDPLAQLYWGAMLFERGAHDFDEHPEREPLERALAALPHAGVAFRLAVSHAQRGKRIAAELDVNPYRAALERALELDPGHAPALSRLFQIYATTLPIPEKARFFLARLEEAAPDGVVPALTAAGWLEQRRRIAEALVRLDDPRHADDWRVILRRARLLARLGRHPEAVAAAERVLARVPAQDDALEIVLDHRLHRGDLDLALALVRRHVADEPWATQRAFDLVRVLRLRGEDEEARAVLLSAHETCPEDPRVLEELATLEFSMERREEGLLHLERAVALDPKNTARERYLRFHQRQRVAFYEPHRVSLETILARAGNDELLADARARNLPLAHLWKQHVVKLNADYTTSRYVHLVTRVLGEEGVQRLDTFRAERRGDAAVRLLEARVVSADGRTSQAALGSGARRAALSRLGIVDLPPLAVGDLVEVAYRVDDLARTWFGDTYGDDHLLTQDGDATAASELTLIHPLDVPVRTHLRNLPADALDVVEEERDGLRVATFRAGPLEAPVVEPAMPAAREILPSLELTTYESWEAFTRWWWNLVSEQQRCSDEMRAHVHTLVEGATTDRERIRRVYEFVANEIDYEAWEFGVHGYKPYDAPTIYSRRHGDCKDKAILINALLGELGITAYPVLIRAEPLRSREDLTLPRVGQFNHCISFVPGAAERGDLFLDGTAQGHPVDTLPAMDRGAHVVVVQDGEPVRRVIPEGTPEENALVVALEARLDEALGATLVMSWEARGLPGAELRRAFRGEELLRDKRLTDLLTARFGATEVLDSTFSDFEDLERPVRIEVRARVARLVHEAGALATLPHVLLEADLMDVCSSTERVHDVLFPPPTQWETRCSYVLPTTLRVAQAPPDAAHDGPAVQYASRTTIGEREVAVVRRWVQHGTRVPVAEYPSLRRVALAIQESERSALQVEAVR